MEVHETAEYVPDQPSAFISLQSAILAFPTGIAIDSEVPPEFGPLLMTLSRV